MDEEKFELADVENGIAGYLFTKHRLDMPLETRTQMSIDILDYIRIARQMREGS